MRLFPFRVKSLNGNILLSFRLRNINDLREALLQFSPEAKVCQLTSKYGRTFSAESDPGVT